jgi:hypothetical protein
MSISDPAHLLQRIPELKLLADAPLICRAIATGDSFKVYRALLLTRLFRRLPEHRDLLNTLISERRLFAKGYKNRPCLAGLKTLGFGFLGETEKDDDGSHIALHAVIVPFAIALIPLGSYLVKSTGPRQWHIYARVPPGIAGWLYSRGLALTLVTLLVLGAVHSYHQASTKDILLLNGFDRELMVTLDDRHTSIGPYERLTINVRQGRVSGLAEVKNAGTIDRFEQQIGRDDKIRIWNIAGAAPLVHSAIPDEKNTVTELVAPNLATRKAQQTMYCGTSFLEFSPVKNTFGEASAGSSLSVGKITLEHLPDASVSMDNSGYGLATCLEYVTEHGLEKTMANTLEAVAVMREWNIIDTQAAVKTAQLVSGKHAIRVAKRALQSHPESIPHERLYQQVREEAGQHQMILAEYAAHAGKEPESARAQYLYAVLLTGHVGLDAMQQANLKFPQDSTVLSSLAWRKAIHADYAGASKDLMQLRKLSPKAADALFDVEVNVLLALGRQLEALNLINASARDKTSEHRASRAADFALVAKQVNTNPEHWLAQLPVAGKHAGSVDFYRVRAGLTIQDTANLASQDIRLALALRNNPVQAVRQARLMKRYQLSHLARDQMSLLYAEAVRVADPALIAMTRTALLLSPAENDLLQQFIRGEAVEITDADIAIEIQSAAYFIRSRNQQISAQERASLRHKAEKIDFMRGIISTALRQWPA